MKTKNELTDFRDAIDAHLSGNPVEHSNDGRAWLKTFTPDWTARLYRPAPIPEPPKPWDCADDVPGPVCWIRICGEHRLVIAIDADGLTIGCNLTGQTNTHIAWVEFGQQIAKWEHSTDRKEWKPCVKKVK